MGTRSDILVVDDDREILNLQELALKMSGLEAEPFSDPNQAWKHLREHGARLVVTDWEMPGMTGMDLLFKTRGLAVPPYVIILTGHATVNRVVQAMQVGAFCVLEKPFDPNVYLEIVQKALEGGGRQSGGIPLPKDGPEVVVSSPKMKQVFETVRSAARTDSTVLLLGESGTGKEVVADYLHACSARAKGPLVKINCGALPEHLLESELFGHEKGAFTGADRRRIGRFEEAHGGTLFLDEIGDLPQALQVKLLRALQQRVIERLGSSQPVPVDFRLISATHQDMAAAVRAGEFRQDLYYRINVVPIRIPALRERPEDILPLAEHFFAALSRRLEQAPSGIGEAARRKLASFPWPGNVRQLRNAIEYALVMCASGPIGPQHLPEELRASPEAPEAVDAQEAQVFQAVAASGAAHGTLSSSPGESGLQETLRAVEANLIREALERHDWNVTEALKELKISRSALYERMKLYGIKRP
ncbi:MAG: sigma-54 dependent transcriptional regulator [Planctomycetota bacterium]|nr:sigma-54 dependent transcriptional regulator [Planctomycetota bacterium]